MLAPDIRVSLSDDSQFWLIFDRIPETDSWTHDRVGYSRNKGMPGTQIIWCWSIEWYTFVLYIVIYGIFNGGICYEHESALIPGQVRISGINVLVNSQITYVVLFARIFSEYHFCVCRHFERWVDPMDIIRRDQLLETGIAHSAYEFFVFVFENRVFYRILQGQ